MCGHLARRSGRLVLAYDLRAEPVERLAASGVKAASLQAIAGSCDVVLLSLPDGKAVAAVVAQLEPHLPEVINAFDLLSVEADILPPGGEGYRVKTGQEAEHLEGVGSACRALFGGFEWTGLHHVLAVLKGPLKKGDAGEVRFQVSRSRRNFRGGVVLRISPDLGGEISRRTERVKSPRFLLRSLKPCLSGEHLPDSAVALQALVGFGDGLFHFRRFVGGVAGSLALGIGLEATMAGDVAERDGQL